MRRLAAHYGRFCSEYPKDQLLIVFDIDGTILDIVERAEPRGLVARLLDAFRDPDVGAAPAASAPAPA